MHKLPLHHRGNSTHHSSPKPRKLDFYSCIVLNRTSLFLTSSVLTRRVTVTMLVTHHGSLRHSIPGAVHRMVPSTRPRNLGRYISSPRERDPTRSGFARLLGLVRATRPCRCGNRQNSRGPFARHQFACARHSGVSNSASVLSTDINMRGAREDVRTTAILLLRLFKARRNKIP